MSRMNTGAIGSRFGTLGAYGGTPLEDSGGPRRAEGSRGRSGALGTQQEVSRPLSGSTPGRVSLAQGVHRGVAAAQAGLDAALGSGRAAPLALADWLAFAPLAGDDPQDSGASLQAWLDIATGHMALQDAMESKRGGAEPATPRTAAERGVEVAWGRPSAETVPEAPPETTPKEPAPTLWPLEPSSPPPSPSALASASARPPAEQGARAALAEARRSFTTALERLDAQLEPALAAALSRLGGQDAAAAAQSAAARMRSQPELALAAQRATQLPGVLGLLRWDFTPLTEPLPDAAPARA